VHNYTGSAVALYKLENGEAQRLGFRRPAQGDTCMFSFPLEKEGVYFIQKAGGKQATFNHVIYLKPGDNKQVDIYANFRSVTYDSCKVVNPNLETVSLQHWTDLFQNLSKLGGNRAKRDQFISEYNQLVSVAAQLKRKTKSSNKYFNYVFASKVEADLRYAKAAAFFHFGERLNAGYDSTDQHRPFYQSLAGQKFCDGSILHSENGLELVKFNMAYNLVQKLGSQEQMLATSFVEKARSICNDTVRLAYVASRLPRITNYAQFQTEIQPFKKLFSTPELKSAYQKKEDELTVYAKGAPAYNFSLTDTKEDTVSLSDFKGKVVVLDIWAMWCAPCLTEKPFFQKLEEEYKDRNDIVFIGVSHDGLRQKEIWKRFVERKGWKNIELIANYNESIGKYYKIAGIPRLMVFDKEGNIVTVDAPRPSSPELKKLIDQTLKATARDTNP
jgi:thiol-disulfide isomerase/thioredoxin